MFTLIQYTCSNFHKHNEFDLYFYFNKIKIPAKYTPKLKICDGIFSSFVFFNGMNRYLALQIFIDASMDALVIANMNLLGIHIGS